MRICIDATPLLLRSAGVKNYIYHWMHALQAEARDHTVTAFPLLGKLGALDHENSVLGLRQTIPRIALLHLLNRRVIPSMDAVTGAIDIFHATNQVHQTPRRARITATLHDMTTFLMPEYHTAGNVRAEQRFVAKILKQADGLIAVSENTRNDAVRILGLDPAKIRVIYSGVPDAFFHAKPDPEIQERFGLTKPYILYVGTIEPRKNVDVLLDAYTQLPPGVRDAYDLVLIGSVGWSSDGTMSRLQAGISGVRYIGYVPEADLPALTAGATVFAYVSLYEGFGFPPAQAMAAGVPVVTSNVSCLPEIAGPGAVLADPASAADVRSAIQKLLTSPSLRAELGLKGRERARQYTWENAARQSVDFFEALG